MTRNGYLREYFKAVLHGVWSGFERTDTIVVVLIALAYIVTTFSSYFKEGEYHPPAWLIALLSLCLIAYEIGRAQYQLYVSERKRREILEKQRAPALVPQDPNTASAYKFVSPQKPQIPAIYVRLRVKNTGAETAEGCSAKLLKIELQDKDGNRVLGYKDTHNLAWANKPPGYGEIIDLHPESVDTLDIVYADQGSHELHIASVVPANYPGLMRLAGQYQFTIQLGSKNAAGRIVRVRVHWGLGLSTLGFPSNAFDFD
jgi:hypothetical protein